MTQLKTNFAIRTTDKNFRAHVETLKALGYKIYEDLDTAEGMEGWTQLVWMHEDVCRASNIIRKPHDFQNIQDFLLWHFTPEEAPKKTEAEILLDSLEEEMQQLQTKIAAVREQLLKEIKEE